MRDASPPPPHPAHERAQVGAAVGWGRLHERRWCGPPARRRHRRGQRVGGERGRPPSLLLFCRTLTLMCVSEGRHMLCVLGMSVDTSWTHRERGAAHVGCAYGGLAWARRRAGCAAARALERSGRVAVPGAARCPLFETERGVERAERRAARPEASVWRRRREVAERTREERATRETHHTYTTWWGAPRIVVCVMCVCVGCAAARVRARLSTHIGSPYVRTAGETEVSVLSRVCAVRSGGVRAMVPARSAATLSHAMERVQLYASPDAKSSSRPRGGATHRPGSTHSLERSGERQQAFLCPVRVREERRRKTPTN